MKIAIYARVSSETQAKEGTIDSQIEALREYAKTHELTIMRECLDDGYTGTELIRPGLDHLRDLAQEGQIEAVLILSPDRLSRKQAHLLILLDEFKKRNVQVLFTTQSYSDSPEDNLMLQIQGSIAEYERVKILDRMRRGTIHSVKNGQVLSGNSPFGYRYIAKNRTEKAHWEVNPDEAKTVRYIYDLYVTEELKGRQIADRLNWESVACRGNKWRGNQIYRILNNESYTGTAYMFKHHSVEPHKTPKSNPYPRKKNSAQIWRARDEWISISVTPILEVQIWKKAQERLKQNARQARRNNNKHEYLLRGLVVCGLCGSMASGYVSNQNTYYSCGAKRNRNITTKPHDEVIQVQHKSFDEKVWLGLTELLSDPENIKTQFDKRMQAKKAALPPSPSTSEFDKELNQLAIQEKRILDAYREEVISLDELKVQRENIANRRKVLESKKKVILSHAESLRKQEITMNDLGDVSKRFQRAMAKANFATREKLVNLLVNSVTLMPNKAIVSGNIPITYSDVLSSPHQAAGFQNRSSAPEKIHGWRRKIDFSRPGLRITEACLEFITRGIIAIANHEMIPYLIGEVKP